MPSEPEELFAEQKVTYSLEVEGRFIVVEQVPARVSLRTGERIRLGRLASDPAGGFRAEVYTVSLVEVVAETRRVRVVTTSGLHFSPGQIERGGAGRCYREPSQTVGGSHKSKGLGMADAVGRTRRMGSGAVWPVCGSAPLRASNRCPQQLPKPQPILVSSCPDTNAATAFLWDHDHARTSTR